MQESTIFVTVITCLLNVGAISCGPLSKTPIYDIPYDVGDWVKVAKQPCPARISDRIGPRNTIGVYTVDIFCDGRIIPTGIGCVSGSNIEGYYD